MKTLGSPVTTSSPISMEQLDSSSTQTHESTLNSIHFLSSSRAQTQLVFTSTGQLAVQKEGKVEFCIPRGHIGTVAICNTKLVMHWFFYACRLYNSGLIFFRSVRGIHLAIGRRYLRPGRSTRKSPFQRIRGLSMKHQVSLRCKIPPC